MPDDEVARLVELAKQAAASAPDVPAELGQAIRAAALGPCDPWALVGVLIASTAHVIRTAIPPDQRKSCAAAAVVTFAAELRKPYPP